MPKIVDHDARRREIVDATLRLIPRIGLESITTREIAREAGVSTGVLSHYFEDKDAILEHAHRAAYENVASRISETIVEIDTLPKLRQAVYEVLPLDDARYVEAQLDVAFWGAALRHERFREMRWALHRDAAQSWTAQFATLRDRGEIETDLSDEELAIELVVVIDGLSVQRLLYPEQISPEQIRSIVDRFFQRLTPRTR